MEFKFNVGDEVVLNNGNGLAIVKSREYNRHHGKNWYFLRRHPETKDLNYLGASEGLLTARADYEAAYGKCPPKGRVTTKDVAERYRKVLLAKQGYVSGDGEGI